MAIRHRWDLVEAPGHVFNELQLQRRYMSGTLGEVVQRSLCRNAMMAHPGIIVLGMLGDERRHIRAEVVELILDARRRRQSGPVRHYKCPALNVAASDYTKLVELHQQADNEPPLIRPLDDEELKQL